MIGSDRGNERKAPRGKHKAYIDEGGGVHERVKDTHRGGGAEVTRDGAGGGGRGCGTPATAWKEDDTAARLLRAFLKRLVCCTGQCIYGTRITRAPLKDYSTKTAQWMRREGNLHLIGSTPVPP